MTKKRSGECRTSPGTSRISVDVLLDPALPYRSVLKLQNLQLEEILQQLTVQDLAAAPEAARFAKLRLSGWRTNRKLQLSSLNDGRAPLCTSNRSGLTDFPGHRESYRAWLRVPEATSSAGVRERPCAAIRGGPVPTSIRIPRGYRTRSRSIRGCGH